MSKNAGSLILTPTGIMSFPHLFTPRPRAEGGEPVYSVSLIFDAVAQKTDAYKQMQLEVKRCAEATFTQNGTVDWPALRLPFRDAGEKAKYAGYTAGDVFINLWSKNRPGVYDPHNDEILVPGDIYAGQKARAKINAYDYSTVTKGVNFGLQHIQIVDMKGDRLDGRVSGADAFEPIEGSVARNSGGAVVTVAAGASSPFATEDEEIPF